tara:strand:+ start:996 stop:1733 length:738 start_codon:yes stop_codon:yes gene_type:complete
MALPVLNAPTYELTLTSSGETIRYRPFLVKEEKILLMALESNDEQEMMRAMKQIIKNCISSNIEIEKLPIFDIQYIFLKLRSQSVGEEVTLRFKHPQEKNVNNETCTHIQDVKINLANIKPVSQDGHSSKIELTDKVGVVMKYPKFEMFQTLSDIAENDDAMDAIFNMVSDNIEMIYQNDEVFYADDHSKEELSEFLYSLNSQQFEMIRNFFQTMPYLRHEFDYVCDACGCTEHVTLNGIEDFFA